jgi:hypothetical protein
MVEKDWIVFQIYNLIPNKFSQKNVRGAVGGKRLDKPGRLFIQSASKLDWWQILVPTLREKPGGIM